MIRRAMRTRIKARTPITIEATDPVDRVGELSEALCWPTVLFTTTVAVMVSAG
jgi:hypothetical protein